MIHKLNLSPLI